MTDSNQPAIKASRRSRLIAYGIVLFIPVLLLIQGFAPKVNDDNSQETSKQIEQTQPYGGQCDSIIATWTETRDATFASDTLSASEFMDILIKNSDFPAIETENLTTTEVAYLDEISAAWWEAYLLLKEDDPSKELSIESATLISQGDVRLKEECSKESRPMDEPVEVVEPLGGYCSSVQRQIKDAYDIMDNAGITATEDEVLATLKDSGDLLSQGYDLSMIEDQKNLTLVRNAGLDLLKIRVSLVYGEDTSADVKLFVQRYLKLNEICRG
jgi:hypothetical protein